MSNPRHVIEKAMTNDMLDEQINFMHDCSRSVMEELLLFRGTIVLRTQGLRFDEKIVKLCRE